MTNIVDDLKWRYACKKFDKNKKLPEETVETILEGLRLTASSYGIQPWAFVRVKNTDLRTQLVEHSYGQTQVEDASDLIILCAKTNLTEEDIDLYLKDTADKRGVEVDSLSGFKKMLMYPVKWEEKRKKNWMDKQLYIALGNLLTMCAHMRIDSCPMEGFVPSKVDKVLGLRDMGLRSVLMCPIGYRSEDDSYANSTKVRFESDLVIKTL